MLTGAGFRFTRTVLRSLSRRLLARLTRATHFRLAWLLWFRHRGTVPLSGAGGEKPAALAGKERRAGADLAVRPTLTSGWMASDDSTFVRVGCRSYGWSCRRYAWGGRVSSQSCT